MPVMCWPRCSFASRSKCAGSPSKADWEIVSGGVTEPSRSGHSVADQVGFPFGIKSLPRRKFNPAPFWVINRPTVSYRLINIPARLRHGRTKRCPNGGSCRPAQVWTPGVPSEFGAPSKRSLLDGVKDRSSSLGWFEICGSADAPVEADTSKDAAPRKKRKAES
jgi:hypothetical protein